MANITVAIPCYNAEKYIERSLRSIFSQSVHPSELIVIDDGSTDDSATVVKNVLADCPFPSQLLSQTNKGIPVTLNRALDLCSNEYFAYLGADDMWLSDFLLERLKLLESRKDAVAAYGNAYIIDEYDNIFDLSSNWSDFPDGDIKPLLFDGNACMNPTVVYRASAARQFRWNEGTHLEDYEMYLRLSTIGPFAFDKRLLSAYRIHSSNMSHDLPRQFAAVEKSFEDCQEILGLDDDEVALTIEKMRFKAVDSFVRTGHPRIALSMLWQNIRAADSMKRVFGLVLRILTPQPIFRWNRRRKRQLAIKHYGRLAI